MTACTALWPPRRRARSPRRRYRPTTAQLRTCGCQRDRVRLRRAPVCRVAARATLLAETRDRPCPALPMHRCATFFRVVCRARGGRARYSRLWELQRTHPGQNESGRTGAGRRCCCSRWSTQRACCRSGGRRCTSSSARARSRSCTLGVALGCRWRPLRSSSSVDAKAGLPFARQRVRPGPSDNLTRASRPPEATGGRHHDRASGQPLRGGCLL